MVLFISSNKLRYPSPWRLGSQYGLLDMRGLYKITVVKRLVTISSGQVYRGRISACVYSALFFFLLLLDHSRIYSTTQTVMKARRRHHEHIEEMQRRTAGPASGRLQAKQSLGHSAYPHGHA